MIDLVLHDFVLEIVSSPGDLLGFQSTDVELVTAELTFCYPRGE